MAITVLQIIEQEIGALVNVTVVFDQGTGKQQASYQRDNTAALEAACTAAKPGMKETQVGNDTTIWS